MEILDNNNLDLQKLMQEIQALPQAKNWGGSTDIVATELSQDLVIPAYTDTELTVKKVEKGVTGIDFGEVTQSKAQKTITVEHSLGVVPKFAVLVPYEVEIPQYETLFWISAFGAKRAYPNLYNSGWQCILSGNDYVKNLHEEKGKPTATDKTISFISGSSQFFASGTYYWFAIA